MLVVMQAHGFRVDERFESIGCVRERGEGEGTFLKWGRRASLSYGGFGSGDRGEESRSEGGAEEEVEEVTAGEGGHRGMMVGWVERWQGDPATSWANKIEYWPPKTCPHPFSDPRPAGMDFPLRGGIQRLFTFFSV